MQRMERLLTSDPSSSQRVTEHAVRVASGGEAADPSAPAPASAAGPPAGQAAGGTSLGPAADNTPSAAAAAPKAMPKAVSGQPERKRTATEQPQAASASAASASASAIPPERLSKRKEPEDPGGGGMTDYLDQLNGTWEPLDDTEGQLFQLICDDRERFVGRLYEAQAKDPTPYPVCEEPTLKFETWDAEFVDNVSGKPLEPKMVHTARTIEIETIEKMGVWEPCPRPHNVKVIATRWVDVNKGDDRHPNYRSRLVAKEIKYGSGFDMSFFAAMPPLVALKMLFFMAVTAGLVDLLCNPIPVREALCLSFIDVSRAHFCADAQREIYVQPPPECGLPEGWVARLIKSMYGTRDAGSNWEAAVAKLMTSIGFERGVSNPCVYFHKERNIRTEVHGDDFTSLGSIPSLHWFHEEIAKTWTIKVRGILGPPGTEGTVQKIDILNRLVTWTDEGIEYEADPRHAEIIAREMGVTGKAVTPIVKEKAEDAEKDMEEIAAELRTTYRSNTMRAAYLSQDRPDISAAIRELTQGMQKPLNHHWAKLKRLARYLNYKPRMVQKFPYQRGVSKYECWCDSNHAGCIRTRKSTSGGAFMAGKCCLRHYAKGQGVIALSSGEAEFYGLITAIANALGDVALAKDWGVRLEPLVHMDATAGIAIGSRRGLGRVKHIDTIYLWVQEVINQGRVRVDKKGTHEMLADVCTKAVVESKMNLMVGRMGFVYQEGRHNLSLQS